MVIELVTCFQTVGFNAPTTTVPLPMIDTLANVDLGFSCGRERRRGWLGLGLDGDAVSTLGLLDLRRLPGG